VGDILESEKQKKQGLSKQKLGNGENDHSVGGTTGLKTGEETPKRKLVRSNSLN
jgi:hypothetical protein